ncbi:MAG: type II toxin-antitoxin system VapC family toxin [Verrucomicrobiales bacterium]|nr:type II toxin-antitoxin system VapC family toxin [Verrucomicrobiales bacterium]
MAFVVDASMVLAWLLPDEGTEYAEMFLERWMKGEAISAPELIRYEVSNALVMAATRRGRLSDEQMRIKLQEFDALAISLNEDSGRATTRQTVELSVRHGLSIYDAAYLELAKRVSKPLATLDKKLKSAAASEGVLFEV